MNNVHSFDKSGRDFAEALLLNTWVSVAVNIILTALQMVIAWATGSFALMSDAIHSLSDMITDIVVFITAKWGRKPADEDHHFGHGKYETFGALVVALFLLVVGIGIVGYGWKTIHLGIQVLFKWQVLLTASLCLVMKEALYQWTNKIGVKYNSQAVLANAWHHRSDALSSLSVLIGAFFAMFGFPYADAISGMVVGVMISIMAIKFFTQSIRELSETSPGKNTEIKAANILKSLKEVKSFHRLRLRTIGYQLFMDMHVLVNPELSLREAHDIATEIEVKMKEKFGKDTNVLVHVEPFEEGHRDL